MLVSVQMGPGQSTVCGPAGRNLPISPGPGQNEARTTGTPAAVTGADKLLNSSVISNSSFTVCAFVKVDRSYTYSTLLTITEKYRRVFVGKYEFHYYLLVT